MHQWTADELFALVDAHHAADVPTRALALLMAAHPDAPRSELAGLVPAARLEMLLALRAEQRSLPRRLTWMLACRLPTPCNEVFDIDLDADQLPSLQAEPSAEHFMSLTSVRCPACRELTPATVSFEQLLWQDVQQASSSITVEVHDIASHYGWSEQAILALTPYRRAQYLELIRLSYAPSEGVEAPADVPPRDRRRRRDR